MAVQSAELREERDRPHRMLCGGFALFPGHFALGPGLHGGAVYRACLIDAYGGAGRKAGPGGDPAMKFAAIIEYIPDKAKIAAIRPAHRVHLTALKERGQLVACGPFTDDSGGLIIYEAATKEEAEAFLQNDPFAKNGVFVRWQLRPWNAVMANRELFPA